MENYDTTEKSMVLWTKLWYYGQNNGTIPTTMELNLIYYGKNYGTIVFFCQGWNIIASPEFEFLHANTKYTRSTPQLKRENYM